MTNELLIGIGTGTVGELIRTEDGAEVTIPITRERVQKEVGGIPTLIDQVATVVAPEIGIREAIIVAVLEMDTAIPTHVDPQETVHRQVKPTFQKMTEPGHGVLMEESTIVGESLVADQEGTRNNNIMYERSRTIHLLMNGVEQFTNFANHSPQ